MRWLGAAILLLAGCVELSDSVTCKEGKPEELVRRINQIYKAAMDSGDFGKSDNSIKIDKEKTTITPAQLAKTNNPDKSYQIECPEKDTVLLITAKNPEDDLFKFEIIAQMHPNQASESILKSVNEEEKENLDKLKKLSRPSEKDLQEATDTIMAMTKAIAGTAGWSDVKMTTCIRRIKVDLGAKKPVVVRSRQSLLQEASARKRPKLLRSSTYLCSSNPREFST